jgi:hypothetical protein
VATHRVLLVAALGAALISVRTETARAQSGLEVTYGSWWLDGRAQLYGVAVYDRLFGPFSWGVGGYHLDEHRSLVDRTQTGADFELAVGRDGHGLYGVARTGLGIRHDDGNLDANWMVGAGWSVRLLSIFALSIETGYRWEDEGVRGFWRLDPSDRRGVVVGARFAFGGARSRREPSGGAGPVYQPPPRDVIAHAAAAGGTTEESADLAVAVVETALDAMGTPYRWGGSDSDGYDCSGLIQWAYGEHGILLPRVSRDQARTGTLLPKDVAALRPGDILAFAASGGGVSHVGLYVGEGKFIHSASEGVKLSSLTASDPDSRWWRARWLSARRILN